MKSIPVFFIVLSIALISASCKPKGNTTSVDILFLHHSTGGVIWNGNASSRGNKVNLPVLFESYNKKNNINYRIKEMIFPKEAPYGWKNYPYDYYNIWVKNAGNELYLDEPTLELLTKSYKVIIFKHCFPVSNIQADSDTADVNSDRKTVANYKLQYLAIRDKLHAFPDKKFIIWTGAVQVKSQITEDEAIRAKEFFNWVTREWDIDNDNISIWDFYTLQTDGELYFKDEYAKSPTDSHPNNIFAENAVKLFFNRIIDVIQTNGTKTNLIGENI